MFSFKNLDMTIACRLRYGVRLLNNEHSESNVLKNLEVNIRSICIEECEK